MNDIGDIKRLRIADILDDENNVADPEVVELRIRAPDGTASEFTYDPLSAEEPRIIRAATGDYFFRLEFTDDGPWEYRWRWNGGADGVDGGTLFCGVEPLEGPFPDDAITVAWVWGFSPFLQATYPTGSSDGSLSLLVSVAAPLVGTLTGRDVAGSGGDAVPSALMPIALQAVAMKTDQLVSSVGTQKARKASLGSGNLSSFRAGAYSESYFGPDQAAKAKRLDSDPVLSELLWALCTEEKKEEWLELWDPAGSRKPAASISAFDWNRRPGGY